MTKTSDISKNPSAAIRYDVERKSEGVAYLLWFAFGALGVHRFYLHRYATGALQFALLALGFTLLFFGIGLVLLAVVTMWWVIDAALIPSIVRSYNRRVAKRLMS